jgi:hypothetical protein
MSDAQSTSVEVLPKEEGLWSGPETVALPSGVRLAICRPTEAYFNVLRSQWPRELVEKCELVSLTAARGNWTAEETTFLAGELRRLVVRSLIEGALSIRSSAEISLDVALDGRDAEFIRNYLLAPTLGKALREPFKTALTASTNSRSAQVN